MTNIKSTKRALLASVMALFLCITMLLGTTYAWFTDSVTSANNIIKSGKLEVGMYWADGAGDVPAVGSNAWNDASKGPIFTDDVLWEPGYAVAKHILITNEGSLDLNYELRITTNSFISELANVIDVYYFENATKLTRATIQSGRRLGTLADIMGTTNNISNTVCGSLVVSNTDASDDAKTITLAFVMQESAGNEYQELSLADFSVQMIATQMASEKDSFGSDYDENALSPAVPAAAVSVLSPEQEFTFTSTITNRSVTVLEKGLKANVMMGSLSGPAEPLTLDAAYQFEPSQTYDDMMKSEYRYYIADFIVSADRDVPANSIALAGYYDAWCNLVGDKWVAMKNENDTIAAGTEIRLVQLLGASVHYKDICQYGNDGVGFVCGLADLTGQNAGTTITVKLCLFKTDADPNGSSAGNEVAGAEPIVIGEFKYTFPKVVDNQTELHSALSEGGTITLEAGNYTMPEPDLRGKTLTIVGTKDAVIDVSKVDARDQFVTGATLAFDGVTLNFGTANYMGFANTASLTYKNCTINGLQFLFGEQVTFENCDLNSNGAEHCVWTYGAKNVSFTGCNFTYGDRGINCYSDNDISGGKQTVNFTNCTFATENTASEGAVEINSCFFSVGIEVNMDGCTAPAYGKIAYVSRWDSTNGAKTTINIK